MSVFYCQMCDRLIDSDFDDSEEIAGEMVCASCYENMCDEDGNLIEGKDDG